MSQAILPSGIFGEISTIFQLASSIRVALKEATGAMAQVKARMHEIKAFTDALGEIERTVDSVRGPIHPRLLAAIAYAMRNCLDCLKVALDQLPPVPAGKSDWRSWLKVVFWGISGGQKEVDESLKRGSGQLAVINSLLGSCMHQEHSAQLTMLCASAGQTNVQVGQIFTLLREMSTPRESSALLGERFEFKSSRGTVVDAGWFGGLRVRNWFVSRPFTAGTALDPANTTGVVLLTMSHDQGWASDVTQGSWTWFEVCIARRSRNNSFTVEKSASGKELAWRSHCNEIATRQSLCLTGDYFGPEHELWRHVGEGHVLLVRACAQYGGWTNYARKGVLRFVSL